ncbi:RTX toxins and related Ca2+-binding protein [Cupriavidus necator H850]|uniref:carbohydrate-binding family V/XII n=1 Tax=Cupriavidus necator TaxID=106590 RepID=UPI00129DCACB|nr:carbohydrate-binding family V/XII [Cupriavidus necator]KAI3609736.1 RTX toxins and related Ca2+-binding protein [Cupriavidus necator H850]
MSFRLKQTSALIAAAWLAFAPLSPQAATPSRPTEAALSWPRNFDAATDHVELYQPQIETWDGNRLSGRAAVAVGEKSGSPTYGVVHFSATGDIDKPSGLVQLTRITVDSVEVPTRPDAADRVHQALVSRLPANGLTVPLDQLQASYAVSQQLAKAGRVAVRNDVPQILFATTPTLLVLVDGEPAWRAVPGTQYERALNSRALLLRESGGELHLKAAGYWYRSESAGGAWEVRTTVPKALESAATKAAAGMKPDSMLPADGKRPARAPAILFATQPTELVMTSGAPQMTPVSGVGLLTMSNADHAVFVDPAANQYYVLVSGRWFRAPMLTGPWEYVPGSQLPADFAKIPATDPKANVLVSVPGTPQAREAEIAAAIPQTATVSRSKASLAVEYDGAPRFTPITGTSLSYAVNSGTPVIEVDSSHYYAVANGVWFTAPAPSGPWHVATEVPSAIYTIPPTSPVYYVTYVRIYSVAPETVVVGYTPGYMGVVVSADGTVVYGTGYVYPPYVGAVYYGYPATYGYGAGFGIGMAEGFAFGFAAGAFWGAASPYWGPYWWGGAYNWNYVNVNQANFYGRWGQGTVTHAQGWNAWTGTEWRGTAGAGYNPATGARYQGSRGAAFNPYSGNYAAGRQGSFANPSTGREGAARGGVAGNTYTGNYAAGRQAAGYNAQTGRVGAAEAGIAGNTQTGQHTAGSRGFVANPDKNNAVVWNNGNVYAGHDGSVYQHTDDGWQKHTPSGWQPVQSGNDATTRLEQQRQAREVGQQRFQGTAQQWQGRGGGGGFGGFGGRAGGFRGGGFHGGFRR